MTEGRDSEKDQELDPDYEPSKGDAPRFFRKVTINLPQQEGGVNSFTLSIPPELKYDGVWGQSGGRQPEESEISERYKVSLTLSFLQETESGTYYPIPAKCRNNSQ